MLDEHGFAWFEEPLSPECAGQFRQLHEKVDVPLASGECEQTRYGFQRLLSSGGVQIAQPDLAYCGGPSEALKIRTIASSLGVNVIPHCWGTMLNLAAATHFLAAGFREPGRAEDGGAILQLDRTPNLSRALRAAAEIDAGSVCVNEFHYAVQLPHGGVKQSGVGKDCSRYSIDGYDGLANSRGVQ